MSRVTEIHSLLGSLLGNAESHPDKLLIRHLEGVARLMKALAMQAGMDIDQDLLLAVALTHDIGKIHPDFQSYLHQSGSGINHAKPSAWFTYSLVKNLMAAEVVCRHHTHLCDMSEISSEWMLSQDSLRREQKRMGDLIPDWPWKLDEVDRKNINRFLGIEWQDTVNIEQWFTTRSLYSLLITADRMEAIGVEQLRGRDIPTFTWPAMESRSQAMDQWRQRVQEFCFEQAKDIKRPGVYTLTLPTGAGKTLTGLSIAHEWSKRLGLRSIIYSLPFISIVEQTTRVAKTVFEAECIQEDHSLAYSNHEEGAKEKGELVWRKMSSLFRYWREPVILTTLVQLWDAMFNTRANHTMNFHRLHKAVIILDEPQTIPPQYWENLGQVMEYLSQKCNVYFLLMTATQPHIPARGELAPPGLAFPYIRHRYKIVNGKYRLDELTGLLDNNVPLRQESGMIVVNRKSVALDVYRILSKLDLKADIYFLSGWVTSWRRQRTLEELRKIGSQRHYLVATQVVEAGVDLDFGWVFRDVGPLDSIIQVAGRCNRHLSRSQPGAVVVAELVGDTGESFWRKVYSSVLIDSAKKVLSQHPDFNEQEVPVIIDQYYRYAKETTPEPIFDYLVTGSWNRVPKLIEDELRDSITVFIEETDWVWPLINRLQTEKWDLESRGEQKKLMQQLQQFAIEIPAKFLGACQWKSSGIYSEDGEEIFRKIFGGKAYFLSKAAINEDGIYHPRLGFIPPEDAGLDIKDLTW